MYEVTVKGGVYAIPPAMCVACGRFAAGDHLLQKQNSDLKGTTFLKLRFPLCDECAAVHEKHFEKLPDVADAAAFERVANVRKTNEPGFLRAVLSLLALPALIAGAIWILPIAWWISLVLAIVAWLVVLSILVRDKVHADPQDLERVERVVAREKDIDKCVKVTGVSRDAAAFQFSNPGYGHAFAQANVGRATERAA